MNFLRRHIPLLAGVLVYLLLYAVASFRYNNFLTARVFLNFLEDYAPLGILAAGMTFVILSGGIDLSVGAVAPLSGMIIGVCLMELHWPVALAVPAGILAGAVLGLAMGLAIQYLGIQPFIVTLAGMFFARGLGFVIHRQTLEIVDKGFAHLVALSIPLGPLGSIKIIAPIFLGTIVVAGYVLRMTSFGRCVYALGGSEEAALLMGLPVARTRVAVYTLSGLCSGLAGFALMLYKPNADMLEGVGMELDTIAAVVIGGTLLTGGVGSILGTLVGVLTIGLIQSVITSYEGLSSGLTRVATGLLLLLFVLLQRVLMRRGRT